MAREKRERALLSIEAKLAEVQAKLGAAAVTTADLSNKALRPLQDLKTRIASQTSIAQIMLLQAAGGDAMDDAINIIEAAATKRPDHVAMPGNTAQPLQTGQPNVPAPVVKATRVIRAAELSSKTYLETEADVDAYLSKLKDALLTTVRAGQLARIQ